MSSRHDKRKKGIIKKIQVPLGIPEPTRESLFDILCDNLYHAKKNIYVNRIIYLGEHSFGTDGLDKVSVVFSGVVKEINESYNDEPLTGIFLHYKKYFVHMLEGSEDSIMKHFRLITEDEVYNKLAKLKLVKVINHINQRFIAEWLEVPGKPATLLEKIDPDSDMEKSMRYISNCVQKVYQLSREIRELKTKDFSDESSVDVRRKPNETNSFDGSLYEELLKPYYPEINLLQFLVQTRFLENLQDYWNVYGCPVIRDSYQDEVWPLPSTMVPYSIFEKATDPCSDLPTHKVEQIEEILIPEEEAQTEVTDQS